MKTINEIEQAAIRYQTNIGQEQYFPEDIETAFLAGAEWHAHQSPWISVRDDLPFNHPELMEHRSSNFGYNYQITKPVFILMRNGATYTSQMQRICNREWEWLWISKQKYVEAWMPIPEYKKADSK